MERRITLSGLAAALLLAQAASAQNGNLSGVTMRVLDDLDDVDAVVLELGRAEGEAAAAGDADESRASRDAARGRGSDGARARDRDAAAGPVPERDRDDLEDLDREERSEGKLEDHDVERAPPPEPPAP